MISLRNLSLQRGGRPLFSDVNLTIFAGQKVGLTGKNGAGKSSLFGLLLGELHQDSGDLELPARMVIGHVAQEMPALETPAIDYVLSGDSELCELEARLEKAYVAGDGFHIATLHERYEAINGYTARARAAAIMHGLGFAAYEQSKAVNTFSGGWRVRLNVGRALMCRSDLLLLDEPTNHLDLDAVMWLEQWLRNCASTLFLISHDRDFLDNVADSIVNIEHQQITLYKGNYAQFERQRAEGLALQKSAYDKQQREIAHIQDFVRRFRAKASKARQAQSRLKALSRMETIAAAHIDSPFHFEFGEPDKAPNPLLCLNDVVAGYGENIVLRDVKLNLAPGTRLGLLGRNGAGKSTLIKLLAGTLSPLEGERVVGNGLKIGYFAQHQLEQLRLDATPLLHMQRLDRGAREQDLRKFLGGFGFVGDDALRIVEGFSGGEKARLVLAMLVWQRPNLLLLDEPTNHLDLDMRDALTFALQDYQGALVLVSHDRHLLRTTADSFVLVSAGRVTDFNGDLNDYRTWLSQNALSDESKTPAAIKNAEADVSELPKSQKRTGTEQRNHIAAQRRPLEKRLSDIEKKMSELTDENKLLEQSLADPAIYESANKDRLKEVVLKQAQISESLRETEKHWVQTTESLETLATA